MLLNKIKKSLYSMIPLKIVEKIVSKAIPVSIIHLEKIK
jgi:hypothetical protein